MATKIIKEIVTDVGGNTTIEYSDDTLQKYNVADVVTAVTNSVTGRITKFSSGDKAVLGGALSLNVAPFSHRFPGSNSNGTGGFTLQGVMVVPYAFWGLIPSFINTSSTALTGLTASVFAMTDPTTISGSPQALTVGGGAVFNLAAGTGVGPQNITNEVLGDAAYVTCVPRTDGGSGYIIGFRVYTPASNGVDPRVLFNGIADNTFGPWRRYSSVKSGDNTAQANLTGFGAFNCCFPMGLQLFTDAAVISVLYAGDSTAAGINYNNSPIQYASGFDLAVIDAQNAGTRVEAINIGFGSQTAVNYYINGTNEVNRYRPTVAVMIVGSPNDVSPFAAYSAGWVSASMVLAAQWATYCRSLNVMPGFATCSPNTGISVGQEANRRLLVAQVKAMADAIGAKIIDRDSVWTDYSTSSGGYKAGLSSDAVHPNGAGYTAEKALWAAMLATIA